MNKKKLFIQLMQGAEARDNWLDTVPSDIRVAFVDNTYVNSMCSDFDALIEGYFGDTAEEVFYFLYEWPFVCQQSGPHIITPSGKEWSLPTLKEVVKYMEEGYGW